jgi:SAM-dependent methyltransferase
MRREWYETFFSPMAMEFWRAVVPPDAAHDEVDLVERVLGLDGPGRLLDLPCGEGRHALELARRGHRVTGVDLSRPAVERAQAEASRAGTAAEFLVGDMRAPPAGPFDGACCLGNSLGYLSHEDLRGFLRATHASLRPGARWVVDTGTAAESLLPRFGGEDRALEAAGIRFTVRQRYDAVEGRLVQEATLVRGEEREEGAISYGVYTVAELRRLFLDAGWSVVALYGALDGRPFSLGDPRLVVVAERPGV